MDKQAAAPNLVPPEPLAVAVARMTLDPGYRAVAVIYDNWATTCTCAGGSQPQSQIDAFAAGLMRYSSDPAMKLIAPLLANLVANCCPSVIVQYPGVRAAQIRTLTLDPGAFQLAAVFDAMYSECCSEGGGGP